MRAKTTIYAARRIVTMNPRQPEATHLAVRDGRILAVGDAGCADGWGGGDIDTRFADRVLLPGFVEGHSHLIAGSIWRFVYAGFHRRMAPDGTLWDGLGDTTAVLDRLATAERGLAPDQFLIGWGFDPIFLTGARLSCRDLDRVSATRPIAVMHSNFHMVTVNSAALALAQYGHGTAIEGVGKDDDGALTGEIRGMAAMFPILRRLGVDFRALTRGEDALIPFADTARRCGVTTATDLLNELTLDEAARLRAVVDRPEYPVRLYVALSAHTAPPRDIADLAVALAPRSTAKLRLGAVKIVVDGSVQAFSAQLRWPGYYRVPDHAVWNMAPERLGEAVDTLNARGVQMQLHTNGDLATDVALDALDAALARCARPGHRHTLQHCQIPDRAQFQRMGRLGIAANLFANHVHVFGDVHRTLTLGPDRAQRLASCRTALESGVRLAIHSDAPVTPMGPLFAMWCAVNRRTASGFHLNPAESLTVDEAMHAVTLGAAWTLGMEGEVGSIETGKRADFAVLDEDPRAVDPLALKDIRVRGTVLDGMPFADA